jgi:UDP-N-acetylmuramoyl-tripeptide--D-alanyl-D-alanine ligase
MKTIFKKIIYKILEIEARLVLKRFKPKIIAITGTVGKTTTKDAIYEGLKNSVSIRKNEKSLNSDVGVPLTILDLKTGWNNPWLWIKNVCLGFSRIFHNKNFPEWLVLETGIDRPNDMKKLTSWLKPDIAVVTAFGEVPVHVEFFDSIDALKEEQSLLAFVVKEGGKVILNADDDYVLRLKNKLNSEVYTYSIENESDVRATNYEITYEKETHGFPNGIVFKVNYDGNSVPINILGVVGKPVVYSVLPVIACAVAMDISVLEVGESLRSLKPTPGRMNLLKGKNEILILDDSYNASPTAVLSALETLKNIKINGKKIFAFGDMLELGRFSANEHRKIGEAVIDAKIDYFITVGFRSKISAEEAIKLGMPVEKVFNFRTSLEVVDTLKEILKGEDVLLVKGSQGTRMEKIVRELICDEIDPLTQLVRQEKDWEDR